MGHKGCTRVATSHSEGTTGSLKGPSGPPDLRGRTRTYRKKPQEGSKPPSLTDPRAKASEVGLSSVQQCCAPMPAEAEAVSDLGRSGGKTF